MAGRSWEKLGEAGRHEEAGGETEDDHEGPAAPRGQASPSPSVHHDQALFEAGLGPRPDYFTGQFAQKNTGVLNLVTKVGRRSCIGAG